MNRLTSYGGLRGFRFAILALVLASGVAVSRDADAAQVTQQQKQEMKQHYDRATRAYDVGKYPEAIEEYQKAYEIGGDPAMLYNIAQSFRLNDQLTDAIRFYRRYLQRAPNARNREDVERKIADLEKIVEERKKTAAATAPAPPPVTTPAPTPPPPAAETKPAEPPAVGVEAAPPEEAPPSTGRGRRIVGYSLLGVAGLGVAGMIWQGNTAREKATKLSDQSKMGAPFDPAVETNGKRANVLAIVSGAVGAAALVAGALVLFTAPSRSDDAPKETARARIKPVIAPVLGADVVGAGAAWTF
jgi:tetratricopeptide (TPR) repeat protein